METVPEGSPREQEGPFGEVPQLVSKQPEAQGRWDRKASLLFSTPWPSPGPNSPSTVLGTSPGLPGNEKWGDSPPPTPSPCHSPDTGFSPRASDQKLTQGLNTLLRNMFPEVSLFFLCWVLTFNFALSLQSPQPGFLWSVLGPFMDESPTHPWLAVSEAINRDSTSTLGIQPRADRVLAALLQLFQEHPLVLRSCSRWGPAFPRHAPWVYVIPSLLLMDTAYSLALTPRRVSGWKTGEGCA